MRMRPCATCRLNGRCELQAQIRDATKAATAFFPTPGWSMRPTLLSFRCDRRVEGIVPGAVCKTTLIDTHHEQRGGDVHEISEERETTCVVMQGKHGRRERFICYLPPDKEGLNQVDVIHRTPAQLEPTGEVVAVCADCDRPLSAPIPDPGGFWSECGERGGHRP